MPSTGGGGGGSLCWVCGLRCVRVKGNEFFNHSCRGKSVT